MRHFEINLLKTIWVYVFKSMLQVTKVISSGKCETFDAESVCISRSSKKMNVKCLKMPFISTQRTLHRNWHGTKIQHKHETKEWDAKGWEWASEWWRMPQTESEKDDILTWFFISWLIFDRNSEESLLSHCNILVSCFFYSELWTNFSLWYWFLFSMAAIAMNIDIVQSMPI